MSDDKLTRSDLDNFSAQILINLGIVNAAALAATFADIDPLKDHPTPFAIGLISSIISQSYWYFQAAVEYGSEDHKDFLKSWEDSNYFLLLAIFVIFLGFISAGCLIYGGLRITGIGGFGSFLISFLVLIIPLVLITLHGTNYIKKKKDAA
jgi:hypothetical protein